MKKRILAVIMISAISVTLPVGCGGSFEATSADPQPADTSTISTSSAKASAKEIPPSDVPEIGWTPIGSL